MGFSFLSAKTTSVIQEVGTASCKYFNDDNSNIHKRKWHNKPAPNRQQFPTEMENRFVIAKDEKGGWQSVLSGCRVKNEMAVVAVPTTTR